VAFLNPLQFAVLTGFLSWLCQDCPDDPGVVLSGIEDGLAICGMPEGCARTSECDQFLAYYQRCLKPFQPFVIGEGFGNSTVMSVIAACHEPRLKQASGRTERSFVHNPVYRIASEWQAGSLTVRPRVLLPFIEGELDSRSFAAAAQLAALHLSQDPFMYADWDVTFDLTYVQLNDTKEDGAHSLPCI
jgi:hypothetical protein